jgi:hypothetical protein
MYNYWKKIGGVTLNKKQEKYLTNAPQKQKLTIATDHAFPNLDYVPGDSIDGYTEQKTANGILAADEIGQQNENL